MDKYKEFENISINDLGHFFVREEISELNKIGIINLSQLFKLYDDSNFSNDIKFNNFEQRMVYKKIFIGIKLLKCKYLDEDPLIDENIEDINIICLRLGLSKNSCNSLRRFKIHEPNFNFFELMRESDALNKICKIRNIGEVFAKEIYERAIIVVNYHDKHKDDKKDIIDENSEKETLEYLYDELKKLREENARIEKEINIILGKIEEKTMSDSKGGINK